MKVLAIGGPSDSGKTTLVERLAGRLSERGPVGTVKHVDCEVDLDAEGTDTDRHRAAGAARTYGITDGERIVTGDTLPLEAALDDLAHTCEYALVEGYRGATLPRVVLGAGEKALGSGAKDHRGRVLARARSADEVSLPELVDEIEGLSPYVCPATLESRIRRSFAANGTASVANEPGALATLAGRVPRRAGDGGERLVLSEPDPTTSDVPDSLGVRKLVDDLHARDGVRELLVGSRAQLVDSEPGAVFVVALADDRNAAFRAVEDARERIESRLALSRAKVTVGDESDGAVPGR